MDRNCIHLSVLDSDNRRTMVNEMAVHKTMMEVRMMMMVVHMTMMVVRMRKIMMEMMKAAIHSRWITHSKLVDRIHLMVGRIHLMVDHIHLWAVDKSIPDVKIYCCLYNHHELYRKIQINSLPRMFNLLITIRIESNRCTHNLMNLPHVFYAKHQYRNPDRHVFRLC